MVGVCDGVYVGVAVYINAVTLNDLVANGADAHKILLFMPPPWAAVSVHTPDPTILTVVPFVIVQIDGVDEVYVACRPDVVVVKLPPSNGELT